MQQVPAWTLADRLAKARHYAGLEGGQLADLIYKETGDTIGGKSAVSRFEGGHRKPRNWVINAWAHACGVSAEWLRTGEMPPDVDAAQSRWIVQLAGQKGLLAEVSS